MDHHTVSAGYRSGVDDDPRDIEPPDDSPSPAASAADDTDDDNAAPRESGEHGAGASRRGESDRSFLDASGLQDGARRIGRRLTRGLVVHSPGGEDEVTTPPDSRRRGAARQHLEPGRTLQYVAFEPVALRRNTITVLILVAAFLLALWLLGRVGHYLFLLLLAWLLAIAMEPSVRALERRGLRRGVGTALTLGAFLVVLGGIIGLFGGLFMTQVGGLITSLPTVVNNLVAWLNDAFDLSLDANAILAQLNIDVRTLTSYAGEFAGGVLGVISSLTGFLFDSLAVLVFAFFIAADGPKLRRTIASWLPPQQQRVFITVWDISLVKTGGFVASKGILASISAAVHSVFFAFIDLPYWLPLGIFAGVTSQFIPTIGTYIGVALPMLFASFDEPIDVLWIVIFATVYQQLENYWLQPRVSRATMDIHPALALGSVFLGAAIFGPIGALISIPLAAAIISIIDTYTERYELVPELHPPTDETV